jgi:hypothetical protein
VSRSRQEARVDLDVRAAYTHYREHREMVMNAWCDRKFEHVMFVYLFAWMVVLVVVYLLAD